MASTGEIAGQNKAANAAPTPAAGTKQAIVIVSNGNAQNVAIIRKDGRLASEGDCGVGSIGKRVDKWHTSAHARGDRTEVKVHRPVCLCTHGNGRCIESGYAQGEIA